MTYKLRRIVASGIVIGLLTGAALGTLGGSATGAPPPSGSHFVLDIEGIGERQDVTQCVGLGDRSTIQTTQTQAGLAYVPGTASPLQLVCTRDYDPAADAFVDWRNAVSQPGVKRGMSVILLSGTDVELDRWNFFGAWPFALEVIPSLGGAMREVVSIQADDMDRP